MKKMLVVFTVLLFFLSTAAVASSFVYTDVAHVDGNVFDGSVGVAGAGITVECLGTGVIGIPTTTDSDGDYLTGVECAAGETVQVNVTVGGNLAGSNTGVVSSVGVIPGTTINLGVSTVNVSIPEFPITAIPMLLSALSFGLVRKRLI